MAKHILQMFFLIFHLKELNNKHDALIAVPPIEYLCVDLLSVANRKFYLSRDTLGKLKYSLIWVAQISWHENEKLLQASVNEFMLIQAEKGATWSSVCNFNHTALFTCLPWQLINSKTFTQYFCADSS